MTRSTFQPLLGFAATLCLVAACDVAPSQPTGDGGSTTTADGAAPPPGTDGGMTPPDMPPVSACPPDAEAQFAAVVAELEAALGEHDVPGASIVVVCGRDTVMTDAVGTLQRGGSEPVSPDTRFLLGSSAKMFTAALALSLEADGMIDIDAPVSDAIGAGAYGGRTYGELLTHTAGMPRDFEFDHSAPLSVAVANNTEIEMWADPGAVWLFSDPGYSVAGYAMEMAAGEPFTDLLRAHVLEPTGMTATPVVRDVLEEGDYAWGHSAEERYGADPLGPDAPAFLSYHAPTGGVWGSAADLGRWIQVHVAETPSIDPAIVEAMQTGLTPTTSTGVQYAYGHHVDMGARPPIVYQGAYSPGFVIDFMVIPEDGFGVAILANSDTYPGGALGWAAAERFARLGRDPSVERPMPPAVWSDYVGTYRDEHVLGEIEIRHEGDELIAMFVDRGSESALTHLYDNSYLAMLDGYPTELSFWRPEGGQASYIVSFAGVAERMD